MLALMKAQPQENPEQTGHGWERRKSNKKKAENFPTRLNLAVAHDESSAEKKKKNPKCFHHLGLSAEPVRESPVSLQLVYSHWFPTMILNVSGLSRALPPGQWAMNGEDTK